MTPELHINVKLQKVWSPAYLTEGSSKTREKINNTPHPYDKGIQSICTISKQGDERLCLSLFT